jgi:hypothetical protein
LPIASSTNGCPTPAILYSRSSNAEGRYEESARSAQHISETSAEARAAAGRTKTSGGMAGLIFAFKYNPGALPFSFGENLRASWDVGRRAIPAPI